MSPKIQVMWNFSKKLSILSSLVLCLAAVGEENSTPEIPQSGSIWGLMSIDPGLQWLSTSISGEANKSGFHTGLGIVFSLYRENWVSDAGIGWRYSKYTNSLVKIYTQAGTADLGIRYRLGAWQIGPHVKVAFGDDMTFTEQTAVDSNILFLGGLQILRDIPHNDWLSRIGLRLHTDLNLKSQQTFMTTLVFEFGMPIVKGRGKEIPIELAPLEMPPEPELVLAPIPMELPLVQASVTGLKQVTLRLSDKILFDTGMSHLKKSSQLFLGELAQLLEQKTEAWDSVEITGHADIRGTDNTNLVLSEARAKSVNDYLKNKGIAISRMSYSGKGEREPIDPNENLEAYAKNRRVELKFEGVDDAQNFVSDVEALKY